MASASGAPPSARVASIHASPSPLDPSARNAAQREINSASTRTASHATGLGDSHEPVRIEVVAEQHRLVGVGSVEEARSAVVHEVGLVDRFQTERELVRSERREHRLPVRRLTQRRSPHLALGARARGDRVND